MSSQTSTTTQEYPFQAEINDLLHLIVNTFYSNKDIFLRELISNASDALDKIRHLALTDKSELAGESNLQIQIVPSKEHKTLTIRDTGVGMTQDDLINTLGMIAKSGTKAFMQKMGEAKGKDSSMNLIGQFGVGFYSAYLVADKVEVLSKNNHDGAYLWSSDAKGKFSITPLPDHQIVRGTQITLHLKDEDVEYLEEDKIKDIIKKHSEFINYPIQLLVEKEKEVPKDDDEDEADEDADKPKVEEVKDEEEGETEEKEKVIVKEFETLNESKPIWMRRQDEVTEEEYTSFYKSITQNFDQPLAHKHFMVEGQYVFRAVLFTPGSLPFDMFTQKDTKKKNNIKLYVRRVFITDECMELFPDYLSFVSGVVDSDDLPLTISREMLQQSKIMHIIKKQLVKKTLEMFNELSQEEEKYQTFYQSFGKNLKLGVHEDSTNRDKLLELLRYTTSQGEMVSLSQYVDRMQEGQKGIYYLAGESRELVEASPFLEVVKNKGYEVLYMTEPIDEYVMQQVRKYGDHEFVSIAKENLDLGESEDEKKKQKETEDNLKNVCQKMKEILGDQVEKVTVSHRIEKSPAVLVTSQFGWSANMERIMKAQALGDDRMSQFMKAKKTLEINPNHQFTQYLEKKLSGEVEPTTKDVIFMIYQTALLDSGFTLDNPSEFTGRIHRLLKLGLSLDTEEADEIPDDLPPLEADDETEEAQVSKMEELD